MQLTIRFKGGKRSDFGDHNYEQILASSLERFQHRLKQVYLYVEDINGPRGGIDTQCRCVLHPRRMPPIVIQDQDEKMNTLLYRVANRAAYVMSQKADRNAKQIKQNRNAQKQPLVSVAEHEADEESGDNYVEGVAQNVIT